MNHGSGLPIDDDLRRDDGICVSTDAAGRELRLHRAGTEGEWEAREWRVWGVDGSTWIGPLLWSMSAADWAACGAVMATMG